VGERRGRTIELVERSDVVLGPLFTVGALLVGIGVIRRSLPLVGAGIAGIVADQRLPAARRLTDRFRKHAAQA
jgi:hypothetical protein